MFILSSNDGIVRSLIYQLVMLTSVVFLEAGLIHMQADSSADFATLHYDYPNSDTLQGLSHSFIVKKCCNLKNFFYVIVGFTIIVAVAIWT